MYRGWSLVLFMAMSPLVLAENDLGQKTYEAACQNCHAPNLAGGVKAPAAFDEKAWGTVFERAAVKVKENPSQFKTPMDYLLYNVKIGKGLMHHNGLCNESVTTNCSDDALTQAILYMSKKH